MNAMIVLYLCKTLYPGEYGVLGSAYACPTTSLSSVGSRRTTSRNIVWQTGHSNDRMSCPLTRGSTAVSVRSTLQAEHTG